MPPLVNKAALVAVIKMVIFPRRRKQLPDEPELRLEMVEAVLSNFSMGKNCQGSLLKCVFSGVFPRESVGLRRNTGLCSNELKRRRKWRIQTASHKRTLDILFFTWSENPSVVIVTDILGHNTRI